jgi:hypothetical protein
MKAMLAVSFIGAVLVIFQTVTGGGVGGSKGSAATVAAPTASVIGPSGWAVLFVQAYLPAGQGTETSLAPFLGQVPQLVNVKAGSFSAASAVAVGALEVCPALHPDCGYWRITVAAQVMGAAPTTGATTASTVAAPMVALGTRYYVVGVQSRGGGFVSATVPMEIAAPQASPPQATIFGSAQAPAQGDPVADTATHFLQALLAGQGEIGRYLAPGATVTPVTPAPFSQVSVTGLSVANIGTPAGAAPRLEALVGVEATDSAGRVMELTYTLDMTRLLGRWDVVRTIGAPPLGA